MVIDTLENLSKAFYSTLDESAYRVFSRGFATTFPATFIPKKPKNPWKIVRKQKKLIKKLTKELKEVGEKYRESRNIEDRRYYLTPYADGTFPKVIWRQTAN